MKKDMNKDNTEYLKSKFETYVPSPRQLKEERLKRLLKEFEEICLMSDEEWEQYNEEENG